MTAFASPGRCLLVIAAQSELDAVLRGLGTELPPYEDARGEPWYELGPKFDLICTGIGKANAAAAVGQAANRARHQTVLNVGIAGSLPGSGLNLRDVVIATESWFSDEGVQTPERFIPCREMGFPIVTAGTDSIRASEEFTRRLSVALQSLKPRLGAVATVSTCSGTDELAKVIQARTGAIAECMEGAAAGLAARRAGIPFAEVRVISNTTGNRQSQTWDLKGSLGVLSQVISLLAKSGSP